MIISTIAQIFIFYLTAIAGKKTDNHELISFSDCGGKVAAVHGNHDVLLRKRA